jgi:serine/threonine protein kinase
MAEKLVLKIADGPDPQTFDLPSNRPFVVGRGQDSDTRIKDGALSRKHFQIEIIEGLIMVKDLGSSSGTFVNGEQIQTSMIDANDLIGAGDSRFKLVVQRPNDINQWQGQRIGDYLLQEVIAKGQYGTIYKSSDEKQNRTVAIKIFHPGIARSEERRDRFVRAMKTMLPIKDEHIVETYEAGRIGHFCWVAMEHLEGAGLDKLIESLGFEGKLMWQEVWRSVVHITRALHVGYKKNTVHRNVTPNNIVRRNVDKVCKLGDFMFAKAIEGNLAYDVTTPGKIVGSLHYLAPERVEPDGEIDTRTDMYGLAATAYALLTGEPPATGKNPLEIVKSIREQPPTPIGELVHGIDQDFAAVLMKMLAKNPDERFAKPELLLIELEKIGKANSLESDFSDWWH